MTLPLRARIVVGGAAGAILSLSNLGVLGPAGAAAGVGVVVLTGGEMASAAQATPAAAAVLHAHGPLRRARVRAHARPAGLTG